MLILSFLGVYLAGLVIYGMLLLLLSAYLEFPRLTSSKKLLLVHMHALLGSFLLNPILHTCDHMVSIQSVHAGGDY
jgi:hypothetical protein